MSLPKKKSRKIIVNGVKYRWLGFATKYEGDDYAEIFVELFDNPRKKIKATFTFSKLQKKYKEVGHKLFVPADKPPPYIVRQTIIYALKNGWKPDEEGGVLDLGNLDEKLDYSLMKKQDVF
ncbi:hypothetical protein A2526_01025 [candidate division WOR-1 bacterium RIFOXYD2_FULL_36_8]|uniref:Uncharacterized protein n=1 Tax=candidate division WOR-1 bacterium RIFOXYB2_FULL_36_35 TaxID=1802578 RepID=A0A1F4S2V2_UNCSA|nr:MAG: hypothetical protein A2230_07645 [candidate division WOR-1 bacterium RIFOXYA2_FULL_36_21]OGC14740.1 MAG: hypothetical protein A2290_08600 [candidate division WOR-1 bacterium RIFOXYB2_FULL_36_35]OGC15476.1 MAG: hypothetical protein A2282_07820 [candidate division WOR-1 bacterium RIFOXYA12_FULL_36_13]OGC38039.1 MAG: hypothetical protein A2526_01025 [candidate division WOR-1 bacterium RIFOXYD2_FULL_36_8]